MRVVTFIFALLLTTVIINAQPVITEVNSPQVGDFAIYVIDTLPFTLRLPERTYPSNHQCPLNQGVKLIKRKS